MNIGAINKLADFFPALVQKADTVKCRSCSINVQTLLALNPFLHNFGVTQVWQIPQKVRAESCKVDVLALLMEECSILSRDIVEYIGNIKFYAAFTNLQNKRVPMQVLRQFPQLQDIKLRDCILEGDCMPGFLASLELFNCRSTQRLTSVLSCAKKLLVAATNVNFQQTFAYLDDLQVYDQDFVVDVFRFPKLQSLSICDSKNIGSLKFSGLQSLTLLNCALPALDLASCEQLQRIEAHECGIATVKLPECVEDVDLSKNCITRFELSNMQLKSLNLSDNQLQAFSLNTPNLKSLWLDGCGFANVPTPNAPNLELLSIRRNYIECFWQLLKLQRYERMTHLLSDFQRRDLAFQSFPNLQFYNSGKRVCAFQPQRSFLNFQASMHSRMGYGEEDVDRFRELLRHDRRCVEGYLAWRVFEQQ